MGKVLSEINLGTRVAMILVPFKSATSPSDWRSSSQANNMGSPSSLRNGEASPGLFARILSYFNPFSYFSGASTNQDSTSRDSVWQYGELLCLMNFHVILIFNGCVLHLATS